MKNNKILLLIIAIIFIASLNFAFASDGNTTEIISEINEETVTSSNDDVAGETDYTQNYENSIKMQGVIKRYNGAIQYKATFYDLNGNPLKNTDVLFEVDDNNDYGPVTDSNGVALLTIMIKNGNHKISAYNPSTYLIANDNIKVFDVITGGKDIEMYYDGADTYKVRIFDNNGNPVKSGQSVSFTIDNKKVPVKTDKNGYATLKLNQKPGYYQVTAQYKDFKTGNLVFIKPVLKSLTSFKSRAFKPTVKFQVKYLGKNKKNKKIKLKFNKKTYSAKTNKKGVASFKLKTPKKVGKYPIVVVYKKTKLNLIYTKYYY